MDKQELGIQLGNYLLALMMLALQAQIVFILKDIIEVLDSISIYCQ